MKAVLMSIQPKWCELIASGKKTVEVRKTRPKLETPFKVYIYCTKNGLKIYGNEKIYVTDTAGILNENAQKGFEKTSELFLWNKKVIGEFVCDKVIKFETTMDLKRVTDEQFDICKDACLNMTDLYEYAKGKQLYGWHISNLVLYDKPIEYYRFYKPCSEYDCFLCNYWVKEVEVCSKSPIERPPQSWYYVEEEVKNNEMCSYVIVVDEKHHMIRHIVDIDEPYDEEKFKKLYYEQYAQLEYDKFIYCSTRDERDEFINKLETE